MKTHKTHTFILSKPYFIVSFVMLSVLLAQCSDAIFDSSNREPFNLSKQNLSTETLPGGALFEIVLPDQWTDLVVYAHGYVNPQEPLALPSDSVDGQPVSGIITQLGFAYATTSYRANGLVGPEAVTDILELINTFISRHGTPGRIYLVGVSEGALVTTLSVEQNGGVFSGGFATCGPVGDFVKQVNYLGDFHVLFNYFFPGLIDGDPSGVPDNVINNWLMENSLLKKQVTDAVNNNPSKARTLLKVAKVPVENDSDINELRTTIFSLLRYSVLATNNAIERLGGQPFDNRQRYYFGTGSFFQDLRLNRRVVRFSADASALTAIENQFQTSGDLSRPMVMMHTTGDQEVPYWHEPIYRFKALSQGSSLLHSNIPIFNRFGHCNFELNELLTGFGLLVFKASLQELIVPSSIFEEERQKHAFLEQSRKEGLNPVVREVKSPIQ